MSNKPDYAEVRSQIRQLVNDVIKPNAEREDAESLWPRENLEALAKAGWNSVLAPKELDGLGFDHVAYAIAAEEIGRASASTGLVYVMHVSALQTILLYGSEDQKKRWGRPSRDGVVGTFSFSEKETGGHWWFSNSEAGRVGDDYVINARKSFTTSSGKADYYIVQTRRPGATGPKDVAFFIVDGKSEGITPGTWDALGVRGNHSGPITYTNVKVPPQERIGSDEQGRDIIYHGVTPVYLIGLGAVWHGVAQATLEEARTYLSNTLHQDFNKRLSDYQVLRQKLAEAKVAISALGPWQRSLAEKLTELQANGEPQGQILLDLTEFKVFASETANQVAGIALDVSGGYGYKRGALERYYRDARAGIGNAPSNNIAREWVGKALVGLPLELFEVGGE